MINHETISFELHLAADYWDLPPLVEIAVNDVIHYQGPITDSTERPNVIGFNHKLNFGKSHKLVLNRLGKCNEQIKVSSDGTVQDQLLLIQRVVIDGINIRDTVLTQSWFEPIYPEPWATEQKDQGLELKNQIYGEMVLGHNGKWIFQFTSPFYEFLISNVG